MLQLILGFVANDPTDEEQEWVCDHCRKRMPAYAVQRYPISIYRNGLVALGRPVCDACVLLMETKS